MGGKEGPRESRKREDVGMAQRAPTGQDAKEHRWGRTPKIRVIDGGIMEAKRKNVLKHWLRGKGLAKSSSERH